MANRRRACESGIVVVPFHTGTHHRRPMLESHTTRAKAERARAAAQALQASPDAERAAALEAVARALAAAEPAILAANREDLERARREGLAKPLLNRLTLDPAKLATVMDGVRQVASLPDPIGRTLRSTLLDDGLTLYQVTCPLGVVACIFESRPDVVVQISALGLRSANAVLLKGGREAAATNAALAKAVRGALSQGPLPEDAIQLLEDRQEVQELLDMDDLVDLIVPRGSNELVRHIKDNTRIPVMGHADGVCHVYVDEAADADKATQIILDAKLDYPAACNAVEAVLVHRARADMIPGLAAALRGAGVEVRGGPEVLEKAPDLAPLAPEDIGREWNDTVLAIHLVDDLPAAVAHIARYGSKHTDAIVTEDPAAARQFVQAVDSAGVYVNASTRFADGYRYGLGAEVGIATGKLHARGPVGLEGLTTYRWVLVGEPGPAHVAGTYKHRAFRHEPAERAFSEQLEAWARD